MTIHELVGGRVLDVSIKSILETHTYIASRDAVPCLTGSPVLFFLPRSPFGMMIITVGILASGLWLRHIIHSVFPLILDLFNL